MSHHLPTLHLTLQRTVILEENDCMLKDEKMWMISEPSEFASGELNFRAKSGWLFAAWFSEAGK